MSPEASNERGWFEGLTRGDLAAASEAIATGSAAAPADWPSQAVATGFAADADDYYSALHEATVAAARTAVRDRELADDQQLIHAVRSMDDSRRLANELAERVTEWAASRFDDTGTGIADARDLADRDPTDPAEERLVALASQVVALAEEADALREYVERTATAVAPNLSTLAGPVLAARLVALAGGLEALAKQPSGTVQVLGAEDALFAHLQGGAPPPKHGVIYTHEAVRNAPPDQRGAAARALAGKLSIAARIDHYSGDRRPGLEDELAARIERIHARDAA